jgi:PadR family transcriptional regulator PadR
LEFGCYCPFGLPFRFGLEFEIGLLLPFRFGHEAQVFRELRGVPLTFDRRRSILLLSNVEGKMAATSDLLQGTLDLLILRTLALESMHGWGIAQRIQQVSKEALQIGQGSLYPALHRLEYKGWIRADWGVSENNRRAKFYSLTATGRAQLKAELKDWERLTTAIALVLGQV